jgi:dTDP-glucose 4,6-dehydratase
MKLLVTGGYGFIGSHFVEFAVEQGDEIFIVDSMTYASSPRNVSVELRACLQHFNVDIASKESVLQVCDKIGEVDCVVNFAAESHVDRSIKDPSIFIQTNVVGVGNLLDLLVAGCAKKMIQVSTDEVYGSILNGSWDEASPLMPRSPYSASKASADLLCLAYKNTYGLDIKLTRCANNFGPRQSPEKLIPLTIHNALNGIPIPIYGNGLQSREWIYVLDHVKAIYSVLQTETQESIFNISGLESQNIDLVKKILRILDVSEDLMVHVSDRPGHDQRYSVSSSLLNSISGWQPSYSFDESLCETIEWYRNNSDWVSESFARIIK